MLKNFVRGKVKTTVEYEIVFLDDDGSGFCFPCSADGTLKPMSKEAQENYDNCMKHPEMFKEFNELQRYEHTWTEPNRGTCICGAGVTLFDQYYGACQCPGCDRWYDLFGGELLAPEYWESDPSEEEWW